MVWIGTSGYNYPEWKGSFYPADLPASRMLPYYSARFTTVEINYTFYRLPDSATVAKWAAATPAGFRFTLKAPKRITHDRRLRECGSIIQAFYTAAATLEEKLAVLLFQLGPSFKCDLGVFDTFLAELPHAAKAAFEFRHPSWQTDEVYQRLRARNLALCIADSEERTTPVVATADYGYLRLRDEGYTDDALAGWAAVIREHQSRWTDTYVYFKHEEAGKGPLFAGQLKRLLSLSTDDTTPS